LCISNEITKCHDSNFVLPKKLHGLGLYDGRRRDEIDDDTIMFTTTTTLSTIPETSPLDCSRINGVPGFPDFHWNNNCDDHKVATSMNNTITTTSLASVDWEDQRRLDLIQAATATAAAAVNDYDDDTDYMYSKTTTTRKYHQKQLRKLRMIRIRRNHQQQLRQIVNKHHTRHTGLVKYRQQPKMLMSLSENNDHECGDDTTTNTAIIEWKREKMGIAKATRRYHSKAATRRNIKQRLGGLGNKSNKIRGWKPIYEMRFDQAKATATTGDIGGDSNKNTSKLGLEFHKQQKHEQREILDLQVGISHLKML
jgi:hypothetical protein